MTDNELKVIRQNIACPQFGDDHYGAWGILNLDQRKTIYKMWDELTRQKAENEALINGQETLQKYIAKKDNNSFSYNINAVSGTLRKSHPKSKFCVREVSDDKWVFDETKPRLTTKSPEIVLLQIMPTGESRALIEYVLKTDFEEMGDV